MKVFIETIPHKDQRYETCGDWIISNETEIAIRISELGDWREEMLVAVHELVEVLICKHEGVDPSAVDEFDKKFEAERLEGKHSEDAEAGDDSKAPYYKQHQIATGVERILAAELGVDWNNYNARIVALDQSREEPACQG